MLRVRRRRSGEPLQKRALVHCTVAMASWTCSVCRIGMLGRLHPLARCPPAWPLQSRWPSASSKGSTVRCASSEPDRLPPPDVRKLAQLAQIAVTDEQARVPPPPPGHLCAHQRQPSQTAAPCRSLRSSVPRCWASRPAPAAGGGMGLPDRRDRAMVRSRPDPGSNGTPYSLKTLYPIPSLIWVLASSAVRLLRVS